MKILCREGWQAIMQASRIDGLVKGVMDGRDRLCNPPTPSPLSPARPPPALKCRGGCALGGNVCAKSLRHVCSETVCALVATYVSREHRVGPTPSSSRSHQSGDRGLASWLALESICSPPCDDEPKKRRTEPTQVPSFHATLNHSDVKSLHWRCERTHA